MTELEQLQDEQAQLAPVSDAEIQRLVDAGEDPERLIEKEEEKAARRRVLQFRINSLEKKQAEENRNAASKELKAIDAKLDETTDQARAVMADAWQAARAIREAVERFKSLGDTYAAQANEAALLAKRAGVNRDDTRGLWMDSNALEKTLIEALAPYRGTKPFIFKMINNEG
ncbi:hypothetical protein [Marinobacter sp.]|uniref:hypothetical protein n=1 Tax=Marinobacter sp. TaxID=50741 RepID=UPI003A8D38DB